MTRRERLEAKLAKRESWAESRKADAARRFEAADKATEGIPFGQPILVGHHSEKRHRRALDKAWSNGMAGVESMKMAEHHTSKAGGIADQLERSVFSDDEDAIAKLEQRIAERSAARDHKKAVNAAFKKAAGATPHAKLLTLVATGTITEAECQVIAKFWAICPYHAGKCHPSYELTNIGALIRTDKERIETIKRMAARTAQAVAAGGVAITGSEYVSITFAEKPEWSVIEALKASGFHWGGGSWHGYRSKIPAEVTEMVAEQEAPKP